jgi:hypothetical protein
MADQETTDAQDRAARLYDSHPINERQILHDLARDFVRLFADRQLAGGRLVARKDA